MKMTPSVHTFVMHFGEMGSRWGINRTVGQIYALCVSSEQAITADEIAQALSISRGNVSMGLKELQSWRLVKVQHLPGERKEYYRAIGDVWDMALKVIEERRKREVEPTLSVLRDLLLESNQQENLEGKKQEANKDLSGKKTTKDEGLILNKDKYALDKMKEIHDLLEMISNWSSELQKMSPGKLKTLMSLGAGVSKVIDIKEKFRKS